MTHSLDHFFYPESIAVIGASQDPGKAGYQILQNLRGLGFAGPLYPVNPHLTELFGLKCYPSLAAVTGYVELIIVTVPAFAVPEVFEQAAARGDVKAAVIIASGFSETKEPERVELEKKVAATARAAGIRIIGPNCVGVMNTENHLDTTFAAGVRQVPGGMSVLSQSGALGASIMMFAGDQPVPIGFAKWAHVGNQADVDVLEVMQYYRDDPATRVIAMYMEGIKDARQFFAVAREVTPKKPVIVVKVGRSAVGSGAAASHTGSLAGSDRIYEGAFRQAGVIRVATVEELLDTAKAISMQPLPAGNRILVLTEAGGPGIIAMDELGLAPEITPAQLSPATIARLQELLPPMAIVDHTPGYVDMSAAADEVQHAKALKCVLADPGVDGVVHLSVPPTFLRPERLGQLTAEAVKGAKKPVTVCYLAGAWVQPARQALEDAGIPTFDMPERAARAMVNMVRRGQFLKKLAVQDRTAVVPAAATARAEAEAALAPAQQEGRNVTEPEARVVLGAFGVPFGPAELARNADEAVRAADKLGYPVVLKVVAPEIVHKSDVGGVKANLTSAAEVRAAFSDILAAAKAKAPGAQVVGVLVTPQAAPGAELIIGATRDPQFGPVVLVGFGGIFVEVLKDVSFRVAPLTRAEAHAMLAELKLYPLLTGTRGQVACNVAALEELIVRVGEAITQVPTIREIDLNPVRVYAQGAFALDARIIL